ncbi:MAG: nitrophenyl compound nitroreductase subunit ArsF family protein [Bacteroidales bacterium]|nr:nitrophenyl compound nitroreductase subunit ArsF family protein [Bacteroidales bacterium]
MIAKFRLIVAIFVLSSMATLAQTKKTVPATSTPIVQVYYSHFSARCVTCKAVEAEAKKDLAELYGNKVSFQSLNLDEASNEALAKKLDVSTQALLIVKGTKQVNITNEGFMYARANPAKFKAVIKAKVDELLK